jgi:DNA-directed RNA polymerase subunit K/omega
MLLLIVACQFFKSRYTIYRRYTCNKIESCAILSNRNLLEKMADDNGPSPDFEDMEDVLEELQELEEDVDDGITSELPLKKLYQHHPECMIDYIEEVVPRLQLSTVPAGPRSTDAKHHTFPFLTQYERTRIIGMRANQLSQGSQPFITVPVHVTDVREIARMELEQKVIPYILKRPLPNGSYEYWRLADLMIL